MADVNYSVVDFNDLSAVSDGKTLLYKDNQVCKSDKNLSDIVQSAVDKQVENKLDTTAFSTVSGNFLTAHQSLDGYATETWVNEQGFLTEHQTIPASANWDETYETVTANSSTWTKVTALSEGSNVQISNNNENYTIGVSGVVTSADLDNYYTKSEIDSKFGFRECEVEEDADVEPRDIWIAFKFLNKDYNPQEHNLAIGTVESNGKNRAFKADWQLVDAEENIWMWGVTEGTKLSLAFRYGGGEQSFPLIVDENYKDIPEEMWRQEGYSSLEAIVSDCEKLWSDEIAKHHINFTGSAEVVGWDLTNATSLDNLLGDNPYWRSAIVGKLPDLNSNASHAVYLFGRLYDITSVGKITLPNLNGDIQKILFAMTSLQNIPEIELDRNPQNLDRLFWQDCNVSKSSIENAYDYLNTNFGSLSHTATFTQCGLYKDPTALDNIPASWGGNLV